MILKFNAQRVASLTASVLSLSAITVTGLALGTAVTFAHAASGESSPNTLSAMHSQPVMVSLGSEPERGFDPVYGWGHYNNPLIQSSLLKRDSALNVEGDLARQWHLSNDRKTWVVTLKPGVMFSDGTPVTAEDVAFTFNTAKRAATVYDLSNLNHIEVVDNQTVAFHLDKPDIAFLDNLVTLAIVPKHAYTSSYAQHPVGSGPYKMVRWDKGQALLLTANPYYYGHKPQLENLVVVFSDEDSRFTQFLSGQLDLAAIAPRYAASLPANARLWSVKSVDNRGISWPMVPYDNNETGNDITSDIAIRSAIDQVIDRRVLVTNLLDGHARPAYSIADGLPWSTEPHIPEMNDTQRLPGATRILEKAGWKLEDGIRVKNGIKAELTLYYKSGDSIREQLALTFAQMVKPLGIVVHTRGDSWENICKVMHKSPVLFGFGALSPSEMRFAHHSKYRGVDFYNAGFYSNPEVDRELDQAELSASWEQALPHYRHAQDLIYHDVPWTWLVNLQHLYATTPCLDLGKPGIEPHGHGWPVTNNITDWKWVCPAKQ